MDWDISSKFGMQIDSRLPKPIPSLNLKPEVNFRLYGRHLEKSIWRDSSAADRLIATKFGKRLQNVMSILYFRQNRNKKRNGGRLFSETGSSFISAVDWDISSKFGMQIDFHLLKQMVSLNLKPGVDLGLYGRHLENSIWRHSHDSATDRPISTKFGRQM